MSLFKPPMLPRPSICLHSPIGTIFFPLVVVADGLCCCLVWYSRFCRRCHCGRRVAVQCVTITLFDAGVWLVCMIKG